VTSESQRYADQAKKKWRLPSLQILGDPSLSLARHLKAAKLLDIFISVPDPAVDPWIAGHPYMRNYTNGIAQPSIMVISKGMDVWFAHTVIPSPKNGGGAVDRPNLQDVWAQVRRTQLGKQGSSSSDQPVKVRKQTLLGTSWVLVMPLSLGASATLLPLLAYLVRFLVRLLVKRRQLSHT